MTNQRVYTDVSVRWNKVSEVVGTRQADRKIVGFPPDAPTQANPFLLGRMLKKMARVSQPHHQPLEMVAFGRQYSRVCSTGVRP